MGWSWDFLHHGISWALVQRIMADQPRIVNEKDKVKTLELNEDNADLVMAQMQSIFRI